MCYNVGYMERNGRNRGSPWSLRQTGVYQRYDATTESSTWILLQPSDYMRRRLAEALSIESRSAYNVASGPLHLHGFFLSASERNWEDSIEHVQQELESLVTRTIRTPFLDLTLIFPRMRKLAILTLMRNRHTIMRLYLLIARGCKSFAGCFHDGNQYFTPNRRLPKNAAKFYKTCICLKM